MHHVGKAVVKTLLNRHKRRDELFLDDYSINPYYGCLYNCLYCYTKGSKYGLRRPRGVSVKVNAPEVLSRELRRRAGRREYGIISIASSTEAYQQVEEEVKLTRRLLEIISHYRFPVHIITKSPLIIRDLDILSEIDEKAILPEGLRDVLGRGVVISFSFSTLEGEIARILEGGAPTPRERLRALERCVEEGFLVGADLIPALPFISDGSQALEDFIVTVKEHGARFILVGALTLPGEVKRLYYSFLEKKFPELLPSYEKLYGARSTPSRSYERRLLETAHTLCLRHGVRCRIG